MEDILYKKEVYEIVGLCMEVHNYLGHGFLEIVYKDALEIEFKDNLVIYEREKRIYD
jgi:GxxExxY protein